MDLEELKDFLTQRGVQFTEKDVQHGTQIVCSTPSKEKFTYYPKSGSVVVGGKSSSLAQEVQAWKESGFTPTLIVGAERPASTAKPVGINKDVFVVYGHDADALRDLELMLHKMGLNPIVLVNLTPDGDTIIEKLEKYLGSRGNVGFACVLLTPDDKGYAKNDPPEAANYRARQNVILELGMVLGRLGRKRVAILRKESVDEPSDIRGLIYVPFKEQVTEVAPTLYRMLDEHGYQPNKAGLA